MPNDAVARKGMAGSTMVVTIQLFFCSLNLTPGHVPGSFRNLTSECRV